MGSSIFQKSKFRGPYFKAPLSPFYRVHLHFHIHAIPIRRMCGRGLGTSLQSNVPPSPHKLNCRSLLPCFSLLLLSLQKRMPGFIPRPVLVRYVVDKVALGQIFSEYFGFPLSVPFNQCFILIFMYMLLLRERQRGEALEHSKYQCSF